jgi:drug/metabolite transporter (DMT)-like permease
MNKKLIGSGSLLLVGILFGLSGVIAKYLSTWLNPYQVVEYRFFIAFIFAVLLLIVTKQKISFKKIDVKTLGIFAITFPISVIFFTLAIFNTSVSLAVFSFYTSALVSSFIIGKIFFGEEITFNKKIALFFILLAVLTFTNPFNGFNIQLGFLFGIISGVFQTIASSFQKIVGKSTNRIGLLIIQTLAGIFISAAVLLLQGQNLLPVLPQIPMFVTVLFGIIFLSISYLFLVGFKYTNLNVGSILVSSELFFGPFFAFIFLSEGLTKLELIGGLFVVLAVIFSNRKEEFKKR